MELSRTSTIEDFARSDLQRRHVGAIASLVLISLLCSWNGLPSHHAIPNWWEGLLWGIADPVIGLNRLASVIAIGLLSAGIVRGSLIFWSFMLATVSGMVMHLLDPSLSGIEIAIAIFSMIFGMTLLLPNQANWVILTLLGAIAGLFQGYDHGQSLIEAGTIPLLAYMLGTTLTQYAVAMSAREIGNQISPRKINGILPRAFFIVGLTFCTLGVVFLKNCFTL